MGNSFYLQLVTFEEQQTVVKAFSLFEMDGMGVV